MQWLGFSCLIDAASNQETQTLSDSAGWEGDLSYRLHKLCALKNMQNPDLVGFSWQEPGLTASPFEHKIKKRKVLKYGVIGFTKSH